MWHNFYKNRIGESYTYYISKQYSPFIEEIKKRINPQSKVLEMGCGIGSVTKILSDLINASYYISDISQEMISLSILNLKGRTFNHLRWNIKKEFKEKVAIIHSHGVLEHFNDRDIKQIITNQLKCCKNLLHYVPSNKYNYKSFGDERLLSKNKWKELVRPKEIIEFNNGYDLILRW